MKIVPIVTSCWPTPETLGKASALLPRWNRSIRKFLTKEKPIIACGTWSDPCLCPVDGEVVNANVTYDREPECKTWMYAVCAFNAGFWYAMMVRWPWDMLAFVDHETVLTRDASPLVAEFMKRSEDVMAPSCFDGTCIDSVFSFYKKSAVERMLNCRIKSDLCFIPQAVGTKMLREQEETLIHKGHWWNPCPSVTKFRMEYQPVLSRRYIFDKAFAANRIPRDWLDEYDKILNEN